MEMKVHTCVRYEDDSLEQYRPAGESNAWEFVISGYWSDDMYHSGWIAYYLLKDINGMWIMDSVDRNAVLDGVTEEDVEEGRLNDDQLQALWGMTLEEAQNETYEKIVAICQDVAPGVASSEVAKVLYNAVVEAGGKEIDEPDDSGLLC